MAEQPFIDVLVIGGGINGAGVARDLAGRGMSVTLCEKGDLASATSSASSKLIHGGLRYLEQKQFRMVREALHEREILLRSAPHNIRPMTFVMPHHKTLRPGWMIRAGLFLYDHLGGKSSLPKSGPVGFAGTKAGAPLKLDYKRGFYYSDCWADDARLVILNAIDARERGATILPRMECIELKSVPEGWRAELLDHILDEKLEVNARMVVNASGPWVLKTLKLAGEAEEKHKLRLVKGSHIMVPRLHRDDHAYILQNNDGRVVFVIPFENRWSLIGTTDIEYTGSLEEVRITTEEIEYLCDAVNHYFRQQITPKDVEWAYSGVRPLLNDGEANPSVITRDYLLELEDRAGAPILNIYGGKITAYRRLSEQVGDKVVETLKTGGGSWTSKAILPGAEGVNASFDIFLKALRREFNWIPEPLALRYARAYGVRARTFLRGHRRLADLGFHFGEGVYEAEILYLIEKEWAFTIDDILWRRSKLGLHVSDKTKQALEAFLAALRAARV